MLSFGFIILLIIDTCIGYADGLRLTMGRPFFSNSMPLLPTFHTKLKAGSPNNILHTGGILPDGGTAPCVIKVIGVGGGGGNAVMRMSKSDISGVDFIAMNTDLQALSRFGSNVETVNIGKDVTRGLGAGGIPDNGRKAAEESRAEIERLVAGTDLVFITAGMGGGTGSGAAPIVAQIAREKGALTVGIVTKPFAFEGPRRMNQAMQAIEKLRSMVDTLIIVSNDRLLQIIPEQVSMLAAFEAADDILRQGVIGISDIIIRPGLVNVDFADVRAVMGNAGTALLAIGNGSGRTRARDAAAAAISSPLMDFPIEHATGVVFNVVGGRDLTLQEVNDAAEVIYGAVDPNANIIFGALVDDSMHGEVSITVIATGFPLRTADGGYIAGSAKRSSPSVSLPSSSSTGNPMGGETPFAESPFSKPLAQYTIGDALQASPRAPSAGEDTPRPEKSFSVKSSPGQSVDKKNANSRIVSTEDEDFPDFLNKLKKKR